MKYLLIITVLYWNGTVQTEKYDVPEGKLICNLMGATGGIMYEGNDDVQNYSWTCTPNP